MKEFIGRIDSRHDARFTFATLKIDFRDFNNTATERAAGFIKGIFKNMNVKKRKPLFALSLACFPGESTLDKELLRRFLSVIVEQADRLSLPIVGGHTVENADIIYTLILVEIIPRDELYERQKQVSPKALPDKKPSWDLFFEDRLINCSGMQGCAAKYPPDKLDEILGCAISRLPLDRFGNLFIKDDVILYRLDDEKSVAFSVDIIKPIVNSAYFFGRIAVTHAASDLYAKGVFPEGAVAIMLKHSFYSGDVCGKIKDAGREEIRRLSCEYLGAYNIEAKELFYGALLYGVCQNRDYIRNSGAKKGDFLILTKPIGSGVIAGYAMLKAFDLSGKEPLFYKRMIENMVEPSLVAARVMKAARVNACTDVTGFSLLGHLKEMIDPDNLGARIKLNKVLFLPGAQSFYPRATHCSVNRNMHYYSKSVFLSGSVNNKSKAGKIALLYDAQTSGGLLLSAAPEDAKNILKNLKQHNIKASIIGVVTERNKFPIEIET